MIQQETRLKIADNTGAKEILCIRVLGGSGRRYAHLGDIIIASVKQAAPNSAVKEGDVVRAVIVRTTYPHGRSDGSHIRFDDNAAVLIDQFAPLIVARTRRDHRAAVATPVGLRHVDWLVRELRDRGYMRIVSLAPEVL